jgi:hypothetical protein
MQATAKAVAIVLVFLGTLVSDGQWLAYDFKANIKRVDNVLGPVQYSPDQYDGTAKVKAVFESYNLGNDVLTGLLFVPACASCCGCGELQPTAPYDEALFYVVRKGDKSRSIWPFSATFAVGAFGKQAAMRCGVDALAGGPTSLKGLNQAWASLSWTFDDSGVDANYGAFGMWPYGFLGFCSGEGSVDCTGFGKVSTAVKTTQANCSNPAQTNVCIELLSVSGQLTGFTTQIGGCSEPPIWDLCSFGELTPAGQSVDSAVISGTWSLKLNRKLSAQADVLSPAMIAASKLR